MKLAAHDRVLVVGITGSGKSRFVKRAIVAKAPRVIVFDPHDEYSDGATERGRVVGVSGVVRVGLGELLNDPDKLDAGRLAVVPSSLSPSGLAEEFADLLPVVATAQDGTVFVVEEVGLVRRHGAEALEVLACQSRHWGVPLVLVAQRAAQVPPTARDQCSRVVSFRQIRPEDVQALAERIGPRADAIAKLPRGEFVAWSEEEEFQGEKTENGKD